MREGLIAAGLTALMILLFLGSWRSTLVVMISIPLAILSSIIGLYLTGQHAQHHDPRRPRARGRHSRRRLHRDHREHAPSPGGGGQAAARGDALRLGRHRGADARLHALHQLRVRLRDLSGGPAEVPLCAARSRRRAGDARLLRLVAYADADHHRAVAAQRNLARGQGRAARRLRALPRGASSAASSICARATCCCSARCSPAATSSRSLQPCSLRWGRSSSCSSVATSIPWSMPGRSSCTCARRRPRGLEETEKVFQAVEQKIREIIPEEGPRHDRRRHRRAGQRLQPRLHRRLDHRLQRRRDSHLAERGARADGGLHQDAARSCCPRPSPA